MNTVFLGKNFIFLPEVGSTNTFAQKLLEENPLEGTVIQAGKQMTGRGQRGNFWVSEDGKNLTMSLILYPTFLPAHRAFDLSRIVALALHKALTLLLPDAKTEIKWPNDLLCNGKKISGILIENQIEGAFVKSSVIGIGLNVNQKHFFQELTKMATSLFQESGQEFSIEKVMQTVLEALEPYYLILRSGKIESIEREYLQKLRGYQEIIQVKIDGIMQNLQLVGVDAQGRLALEIDRKLRFFDIKEVEVLF